MKQVCHCPINPTLHVPSELLESCAMTLKQLLDAANAPYVPDEAPGESELPPELVGLEQPGHLEPVQNLLDRVAMRGWASVTMQELHVARDCLRNVVRNGDGRVRRDKREAVEIGFAFADEFRRQYEARPVDLANVFNPDESSVAPAASGMRVPVASWNRVAEFLAMVSNTFSENIAPADEGGHLLAQTIDGLAGEAAKLIAETGFRKQ